MAKKPETMWTKVKDTATNVLHANENAKAKKEAEKRARRNAIFGGIGILGVGALGIIDRIMWKKRINAMKALGNVDEERAKMLEDAVSNLKESVDELEGSK